MDTRRGSLDDAYRVALLHARAECARLGIPVPATPPADPLDDWRRRLVVDGHVLVLGYEEDELVAMTYACPYEEDRDAAHVSGVAVEPNRWGRRLGRRILTRALEELRAVGFTRVVLFAEGWHPNFQLDEARQWVEFCEHGWRQQTHFEFAVQTPGVAYAGSCALTGVNRAAATANLAYWTHSRHAGNHVASRAARLVAAWGVSQLGLQRVEISMATANIPSRRVAERAGAVFEGILRNRVHVAGRHYNFALYALTPQDFHADEIGE